MKSLWILSSPLIIYSHALGSQRKSLNSVSRDSFIKTCIVQITFCADSASATYSAYAARERDWEERNRKGEIKISNASDLKRQLREIVPNDESSKIFCPNGSSSNVTPLMENKCSDRLAAPSVYGRTEDVVGNSVPGFQGNFKARGINVPYDLEDVGGFPDYYKR